MWKVLHINDFPTSSQGGAEVLMDRTVRLLRRQGVAAQVFSSEDLPDVRLNPVRYIDNPVARRALVDKLQDFRPDIVHLHNYYHVLSPGILPELARFRKTRPLRIIMTAHDYHLICPNSGLICFHGDSGHFFPAQAQRLSSLAYLLTRCWDQRGWTYSALKCAQHLWSYHWHHHQEVVDLVICPSRFAARLLRPFGRPTVCLPHPAPAVPGNARSPTRRSASRLRFVFAGRLVPEKGLTEFLDLLPDGLHAEWTVIGEGPERERCLQIQRAKRLDLRFLGRLTHEQTLAEIAAGHVVVLPSRCPETYGLTLIEALMAGTNLLVANQGALRELVDEAGVGFTFTLDDKAGLHEQIRNIQASFQAGTLNALDVQGFLRERSEETYIRHLLELYAGDQMLPAIAA